jgi:hypothetical protein
MKAMKILIILLMTYAGIVVLFESLLGYFQPEAGNTMVITTFEEDGTADQRVVARLESGEAFYVAVNHWPRAWYRRVQRNPVVQISYQGQTGNYRAVRLAGAEYDRINQEHGLGLVFRLLTGFPPRHLFRLDPV